MSIVRNIAAVLLGLVLGSGANMALIVLGHSVVAPPPGVDPTDMDSLAASMHLFEPKHYIFPFLAHAVGTWVGALIAFLVGTGNRALLSWVVAAFFLAGGIANVMMLPAPMWFNMLDLLLAYIPMGWLAIDAGRKLTAPSSN